MLLSVTAPLSAIATGYRAMGVQGDSGVAWLPPYSTACLLLATGNLVMASGLKVPGTCCSAAPAAVSGPLETVTVPGRWCRRTVTGAWPVSVNVTGTVLDWPRCSVTDTEPGVTASRPALRAMLSALARLGWTFVMAVAVE